MNILTLSAPAMTIPVGVGARMSHWLDYEKLEKEGRTSITVEPHFSVFRYGQGKSLGLASELCLFFDPDEWSTDVYGLIYGDPAFEQAVVKWATDHLPFSLAHVGYTEQGMQGKDFVSMEARVKPVSQWSEIWPSRHAALDWIAKARAQGWVVDLENDTEVA